MYAKNNIAVCVRMLLCGMYYVCIKLNSPHLLNASHNSIEVTSPKCSQIHSTSLYMCGLQCAARHGHCHAILCCAACAVTLTILSPQDTSLSGIPLHWRSKC